ncbi:unnamed protein product [Mytilus coruscus]|uniref:Uncharacterized protein n=1 Tax=Mytilus coruscus TaxID=42192 RepID=A0A6J8EAV9_MYTCO|nr:unnamed protein product [Mytilus coruscus]
MKNDPIQSSQGYMIKINTCPKVIFTCKPDIGDDIAARIMDMRGKYIHIDQDVLCKFPHLRMTESTLGIIDYTPRPRAEVSEVSCGRAGSVEECDPQDEVASSDSDDRECSSPAWERRSLEQLASQSEHSTMLEQSLCEPPQGSLSTEILNTELEYLSVCDNREYHTPLPRTNMVVRSQLDQQDSQQDRDVNNNKMTVFSPLSQDNSEVHQQEDRNRQQDFQQAPPGYNSPHRSLIMTNNQAPFSLPQQQPQQQQFSAVVHQQPTYQQPWFQPPRFVSRSQPPKMIGHPTSTFQPPRSRPPPQAPTNLQTYKQYMSCLTYPALGQPSLSGPPGMSSCQPQLHALPVSHQQVSMSGTQQQPPPSGAPQTHYN